MTAAQHFECAGRVGQTARKATTRDIPSILATGAVGSTTVAATSAIANAAGIDVFVTGGIGGVHRGVEQTWDISADLNELGRTPITVICAGVKSILDIPKTLEYLETQGVGVMTLAEGKPNTQRAEFPAFFTPTSGVASPETVYSIEELAEIVLAHRLIGMPSGQVVAVPNPSPAVGETVDAAIRQAIDEVKQKAVNGREVTPYVLKRVSELTGGASLQANIALIKNNARVGGMLAARLAQIKQRPSGSCGHTGTRQFHTSHKPCDRRPVVVGGAVQDFLCKPADGMKLLLETSNPGNVSQSFGGVGRNVAEAMARMGSPPVMCTALGAGSANLAEYCEKQLGMTMLSVQTAAETPRYVAMLHESGDLLAAIADMKAFDDITPESLSSLTGTAGTTATITQLLAECPMLVLDANLSERTLQFVLEHAAAARVPTIFESTSIAKCTRIVRSGSLHLVSLLKPNKFELFELASSMRAQLGLPEEEVEEADADAPEDAADSDAEKITEVIDLQTKDNSPPATADWSAVQQLLQGGKVDVVEEASGAANDDEGLDYATLMAGKTVLAGLVQSPEHATPAAALIEGRKHVLITLGKVGVLWLSAPMTQSADAASRLAGLPFFAAAQSPEFDMDFVLCPAPPAEMKKCTGAGDTFIGTVAASLVQGEPMPEAIRIGLAAAKIALEAEAKMSTVPSMLSARLAREVATEHVKRIEPDYA